MRKSGLLFTALYLKQCGSCLMMAYGGVKRPPELLPVPVSLTRSGYPTIIPSFHRRLIDIRYDRSNQLVRMYLSWFGLAKLILLAKRISKDTFSSITTPVADVDRVLSICHELKGTFHDLMSWYVPRLPSRPVFQGMRWVPSWKSTANSVKPKIKGPPSPFTDLFADMFGYGV